MQEELRNVRCIQASCDAFAAVVSDGSVVSWGDPEHAGSSFQYLKLLAAVGFITVSILPWKSIPVRYCFGVLYCFFTAMGFCTVSVLLFGILSCFYAAVEFYTVSVLFFDSILFRCYFGVVYGFHTALGFCTVFIVVELAGSFPRQARA